MMTVTNEGLSLPNGRIYMPATTIQDKSLLIHEIFHQMTYQNNTAQVFQKVLDEKINHMRGGADPYDYKDSRNRTGYIPGQISSPISSLADIATIEGQARYIQDFTFAYLVRYINYYGEYTRDRAAVLSGSFTSRAITDARTW